MCIEWLSDRDANMLNQHVSCFFYQQQHVHFMYQDAIEELQAFEWLSCPSEMASESILSNALNGQ